MRKNLFLVFSLQLVLIVSGQKDTSKRRFDYYALWGYNRVAYTTSNIHFKNNGNGSNEYGPYDFTIKDAKAHDKPDFEAIKDILNPTIPQYNVRFGIWLNNKNDEGFEINYDHAKYVVTDNQVVRFKGSINGQAVDKDSILDRRYFHLEHTDGANFWMINYLKRNKICYLKNNNFKLSYVMKVGFGMVIPRTDITLFGHRINNNWKVAGMSTGIEIALHIEMYEHIVLELSGKGGYANYINCYAVGKYNGRVSHQFGFFEGILVAGYQF